MVAYAPIGAIVTVSTVMVVVGSGAVVDVVNIAITIVVISNGGTQ